MNRLHVRTRVLACLATLALALAAAGCGLDSPASTLTPRSDFGWLSHRLFLQILTWDLAILAVVTGLLGYALLRFRERDPEALPAQVRGNARLELAWTIAPAVILTFIAFPTVTAIFRSQAAPPPDALRVEVIGRQWWWEFRYPDLGVTTAGDLHLPVGRPVTLDLSSVDVIHSFWIPQLGGKRDALPGGRTRIVLTPSTPGVYYGQCAEYCGTSHANMRHVAVVESVAEFDAWVARQKAPAPTPGDGSPAAAGLRVFQLGACVGCHAVNGVSAGATGPSLTGFASRRTIGSGILPNTATNLARWLRDPPAVKPGSLMPAQPLTEADLQALVAYLGTLR